MPEASYFFYDCTPYQYVGYHNAATEGADGVCLSLIHGMPPLVWQIPFLPDIATEIVLSQFPHWQITNSDLELATGVQLEASS